VAGRVQRCSRHINTRGHTHTQASSEEEESEEDPAPKKRKQQVQQKASGAKKQKVCAVAPPYWYCCYWLNNIPAACRLRQTNRSNRARRKGKAENEEQLVCAARRSCI
jgi:hypothetical protein